MVSCQYLQTGLNRHDEMVKDAVFRTTCSQGYFSNPKKSGDKQCKYLHHNNQYLKMGPIKLEIARKKPYVSILHDLLNEKEIDWLIMESTPKLSTSRNTIQYQNDKKDGTTKIIEKTVQTWMQEINIQRGNSTEELLRPKKSQVTIKHQILYDITTKIQLATQLEIRYPTSSTMTQVTNYGLAGLCEIHNDPYGYIEGRKLGLGHEDLIDRGDIFGTFMAWLNNVEGGGGTAFTNPGQEMLVRPTKGSVAFWHSLDRKGFRQLAADHGGCPVIKGSKWILNRWLYYYDNFRDFSCSLKYTDLFGEPSGVYEN
jgi:prolyl 4-hydroxylase